MNKTFKNKYMNIYLLLQFTYMQMKNVKNKNNNKKYAAGCFFNKES